jgi:hypothetical protein
MRAEVQARSQRSTTSTATLAQLVALSFPPTETVDLEFQKLGIEPIRMSFVTQGRYEASMVSLIPPTI